MCDILHNVYTLYNNFKIKYNYRKYDPVTNYFYEHSHLYDSFIPIMIALFVVINFAMKYFLHNFNSNTVVWRFWYYLIVKNQDHYFDCFKEKDKLNKILLQNQIQIREKLLRYKNDHNCISFLFSELGLKLICTICGKLSVFIRMENIYKRKYFHKPFYILAISNKHNKYIILFLIFTDLGLLIGQIGYGK